MTMVERFIRLCSDALTFLAAICLLLMMLQMAADVVLKYFFNAPIEGNLEIVSFYYMVGVVFLPLAMVELRHEHINVDLFVRLLPKPLQSLIYASGCLLSATFFAMLAYQTYLDALKATRIGEVMMGSDYVTIWPSRWALPLGFTVLCLAVLLHAWRAIQNPRTFDPSPAEPEFGAGDPS